LDKQIKELEEEIETLKAHNRIISADYNQKKLDLLLEK
jgi:hypothetical protein